MSLEIKFSTIPEMFEKITQKFISENRPILKNKVEKKYQPILYKELRNDVENFILGLSSIGVKPKDKIAIIAENRPEWVISDISILTLGAINIPIYPTQSQSQIKFIFNDAKIKIAIVSNQFQLNKILAIKKEIKSLKKIIVMNDNFKSKDKSILKFYDIIQVGKNSIEKKNFNLKKLSQKSKPNDTVTIIYTSGTTGNPKGVELTNKNIVSNIKSAAELLPITNTDITLSFLPLCHIFERMGGYYTVLACGATIAYAESRETVINDIQTIKPTMMTSVPQMLEKIYFRILKQIDEGKTVKKKIFYWALKTGKKYSTAKKNNSLNSFLKNKYLIAEKLVFKKIHQRIGGRLRFFISGGAALPKHIGEFFDSVGIKILEGYGLTETSPVLSLNTLDDYCFGTVGKPIPNVKIKIAKDGEILAKGPNIMKGYFNNKKATNEVIKQGWFHTGDIGMFDKSGRLIITDRKKNLFVSTGGKNIAPQPIENRLLKSKYIEQLLLIGDARQYLTALIVAELESLMNFSKEKNLKIHDQKDLLTSQEIYNLIKNEIDHLQNDLSSYEQVRKFVILNKPFTIEDGELTPTLKIKRKIVEEKYKSQIEAMYKSE